MNITLFENVKATLEIVGLGIALYIAFQLGCTWLYAVLPDEEEEGLDVSTHQSETARSCGSSSGGCR